MAIGYVASSAVCVPGGTTATFPAHSIGDMLVEANYSTTATPPPILSGWTQDATVSQASISSILANMVAQATSGEFGTWSDVSSSGAIWAGCTGIGAVASNSGTTANVIYPALALQKTDGTSWVARFSAGLAGSNWTLGIAGYTQRASSGSMAIFDSNGGVASNPTADTVAINAAGAWNTWTVELLGGPSAGGTTPPSFRQVKIPNRYVGPMALRNSFRQPAHWGKADPNDGFFR